MVDDRRDTVIVEKDSKSPLGWIIGLIVLLILIVLFFSNGGFGLLGGGDTTAPTGGSSGGSVETETNIQAPAGQ